MNGTALVSAYEGAFTAIDLHPKLNRSSYQFKAMQLLFFIKSIQS